MEKERAEKIASDLKAEAHRVALQLGEAERRNQAQEGEIREFEKGLEQLGLQSRRVEQELLGKLQDMQERLRVAAHEKEVLVAAAKEHGKSIAES